MSKKSHEGLTPGQEALLKSFKGNLKAIRRLEKAQSSVDMALNGDEGGNFGDMLAELWGFGGDEIFQGLPDEPLTVKQELTLRRRHGFAMYLDLSSNPDTKALAQRALEKDKKRREKHGLPTQVSHFNGQVMAEAFSGKPWNTHLDPTRRAKRNPEV